MTFLLYINHLLSLSSGFAAAEGCNEQLAVLIETFLSVPPAAGRISSSLLLII